MKHIFTSALRVLLLIIMVSKVNATHIMGGNLGYTYMGLQPNGEYRYKVRLELYRSCAPGSSDLPSSMRLGVYFENTANPNADKIQQDEYNNVQLLSQQFISPPAPNDTCSFTPSVCVEQGIYELEIDVPASTMGYHLIMDRCCRNDVIANVFDPSNEGAAWYAFIPPTSVVNSSPTFAVPPVPFLCANDTNSILNAAFDPDGDVLTYHYVTPYGGLSSPGQPNPNLPSTYTWPIPNISYAAGYSVTQPFGVGGFSSIDTTTGLSQYYAPSQGFYVVAVEIREFRNGVLIGVSRLDYQLIFISCPINPSPIALSGGLTVFSVQEGQQICFPIIFRDPNGDSLSTTHQGPIFNSTFTNPPATLVDAVGDSIVSAQFCWPTSCLQGSTVPYQFTVTAADNGCPAKTTSQVYTIYVVPFMGTTVLNGPDTLCANSLTGVSFSTTGAASSTYNWTITNGVQVTGANTNFISVDFGPTGPYVVSVREVNTLGCEGSNQATKTITIIPAPIADAGLPKSFCSGGSATIGTTAIAGTDYTWSPATGLSNTTISNPTVTLTNGTGGPIATKYVVTASANGCTSTDTVEVIVNPLPISNAGNNQFLCSGNSITIGTLFTGGYTYNWSPAIGLSSSSVSNPNVSLINNGTLADTTIYTVVTTNSYGCTSNDAVLVITNPLPAVVAAATDSSICPGTPVTLNGAGANTYTWALLTAPGTPIGSNQTLNIAPLTTTSYILTGTSASNCINKDTLLINVFAAPVVIANVNDDTVCVASAATLTASGGVTYNWATQASPSTSIGTGVSLTVNPNATTSYIVTATDANGCTGSDTITVNVFAPAVAVAGVDKTVCSNISNFLGTVNTAGTIYAWSPATGLSSTTVSNPTITLVNTNSVPDTLVYTVQIININGCTATDQVTVISAPVPTANAGVDAITCSGTSVQIGSALTSGYSYLWNPSAGLLGPTTSNPTATLSNTTTVFDTVQYVLTTTWFGCTDTDTVEIIVKPNPVSNAGNNTALCSGDTVTIGTTATAGYNYQWLPATGLIGTSSSNPSVTLISATTATTTYTVTTTWNGCVTTDSVDVTVNPLPTVTTTASQTAICLGQTTTLTANGALNYNWEDQANPGVSIGTGGTITVTPTATTTYIVTGSTAALCSNINSITITVNPLPTVSITAPNDSICNGDTIILNGNGAVSYQWAVLGGATIGNNNTQLISPQSTTSYIVTGTDAIGCSNNDTLNIVVNPAATLNAATGTLSVCPDVVNIPYWVLNANNNSTYNWSVNGGTLVGGQGNDTAIVSWGAAGIGSITVNEITDMGCPSQPIVITVSINQILTPIAPTGTPSICANDGLGTAYTTLGTPGSTYTWFAIGGTIASGNGTNSVTVDWNVAGPTIGYIWYQEQSITPTTTCLGLSDTLAVIINPAPSTSPITATAAICVFDSTAFSVLSTTGSNYQWFANGSSSLTGNGSNSIIAGWNTAGTYAVGVVETNSFGCVGDTIAYSITVNALPAANAGNNTGFCLGQTTAQLNASGGVNYSWQPATGLSATNIANPIANPGATTTYTVTVTDANGCSATSSLQVSANVLPSAAIVATPPAICIGSSTQLQASGGNNYNWIPATALSNTAIANPIANPTTATSYTVTVTDANGCTGSTSFNVTVNPLPTISAGNDVLICDNASIMLNATGGVSYTWSPASGLSSSTVSNPVATPNGLTTYTVTGTDVNGCTNTDEIMVSINPKPVANFTTDSTYANCNGITVYFTDLSTDADAYLWNFNDGSTSTDANPIHAFPFSATNTVTLIVSNNGICFDTLAAPIALKSLAEYLKNAANVFTPNGDGKNDCYSFSGLGDFDGCTNIKIFDRWGKQQFSSSGTEKCWDGKSENGKEVPVGTYFYIIDVSGKQINGSLQLLR